MSELTQAGIFPVAYKTKQEVGLSIYSGGSWHEPTALVTNIPRHIPAAYAGFYNQLANCAVLGWMKQDSTSGLKNNLTITTPECASPDELHVYNRASQFLLEQVVAHFVAGEATRLGNNVQGRIQNRVLAGNGTRKGMRDRFLLPRGSALASGQIPPALLEYFSTRHFVDGSGSNMGPDGLRYSQKTDGLTTVHGWGDTGTLVNRSNSFNHSNEIWLESRNDDVNVLDWAIRARIGGTAIMLALLQSPLADELNGRTTADEAVIKRAKQMNVLHLTDDGYIRSTGALRRAIDSQRRVVQLFMYKLVNYMELPDDLFAIASQREKYINDFEKVVDGQNDITSLEQRADWAAKFSRTLQSLNRYNESHWHQRDIRSQGAVNIDFLYDRILIEADKEGSIGTKRGYGYAWRDTVQTSSHFGLSPKTVERAAHQPPKSTRAQLLASLVREFREHIVECGTGFVIVRVRDASVRIQLPKNPKETTLEAEEVAKVELVRSKLAVVA